MDKATLAILAIVIAVFIALAQYSLRSRKTRPTNLVVALKPSAAAAVLAPRGSVTLLEDAFDPKSGAGNSAATISSSSIAFDIV